MNIFKKLWNKLFNKSPKEEVKELQFETKPTLNLNEQQTLSFIAAQIKKVIDKGEVKNYHHFKIFIDKYYDDEMYAVDLNDYSHIEYEFTKPSKKLCKMAYKLNYKSDNEFIKFLIKKGKDLSNNPA